MDLDELKEKVEQGSKDLPKVTRKKMFGCDGFFADGNIYGLIWKTGRIGFKLSDPNEFEKLMSEKGSAPWEIGPKVMSNWVFVPESFHNSQTKISKWAKLAHSLALKNPTPKKKATKKKSKKK